MYAKGNQDGFSKIVLNDLDDIISKSSLSIKKEVMQGYDIGTVTSFGDGTIGFVAERVNIRVHGDDIDYLTYNLTIVRFSAEGEVITYKIINKFMSSGSFDPAKTLVHLRDDKIYLIFNKKKKKNENKKVSKAVQTTDLIILSKEGEELVNRELFAELTLLPSFSDSENGQLLLGCWSLNKFVFGIMTL